MFAYGELNHVHQKSSIRCDIKAHTFSKVDQPAQKENHRGIMVDYLHNHFLPSVFQLKSQNDRESKKIEELFDIKKQ